MDSFLAPSCHNTSVYHDVSIGIPMQLFINMSFSFAQGGIPISDGFASMFCQYYTTFIMLNLTLHNYVNTHAYTHVYTNTNRSYRIYQVYINCMVLVCCACYKHFFILYSLCIIYLMVALGNWVSVPIVSVFGSKWSLVISGALYV